jgi:hypothetical protein
MRAVDVAAARLRALSDRRSRCFHHRSGPVPELPPGPARRRHLYRRFGLGKHRLPPFPLGPLRGQLSLGVLKVSFKTPDPLGLQLQASVQRFQQCPGICRHFSGPGRGERCHFGHLVSTWCYTRWRRRSTWWFTRWFSGTTRCFVTSIIEGSGLDPNLIPGRPTTLAWCLPAPDVPRPDPSTHLVNIELQSAGGLSKRHPLPGHRRRCHPLLATALAVAGCEPLRWAPGGRKVIRLVPTVPDGEG